MPRLAETPEDLLSQSEALSLSGLEFMQKILDGTNPGCERQQHSRLPPCSLFSGSVR